MGFNVKYHARPPDKMYVPAKLQGGGLALGLRGCRRQKAAAIDARTDHLPQKGVRRILHTGKLAVAEQMYCAVLAHVFIYSSVRILGEAQW